MSAAKHAKLGLKRLLGSALQARVTQKGHSAARTLNTWQVSDFMSDHGVRTAGLQSRWNLQSKLTTSTAKDRGRKKDLGTRLHATYLRVSSDDHYDNDFLARKARPRARMQLQALPVTNRHVLAERAQAPAGALGGAGCQERCTCCPRRGGRLELCSDTRQSHSLKLLPVQVASIKARPSQPQRGQLRCIPTAPALRAWRRLTQRAATRGSAATAVEPCPCAGHAGSHWAIGPCPARWALPGSNYAANLQELDIQHQSAQHWNSCALGALSALTIAPAVLAEAVASHYNVHEELAELKAIMSARSRLPSQVNFLQGGRLPCWRKRTGLGSFSDVQCAGACAPGWRIQQDNWM